MTGNDLRNKMLSTAARQRPLLYNDIAPSSLLISLSSPTATWSILVISNLLAAIFKQLLF